MFRRGKPFARDIFDVFLIDLFHQIFIFHRRFDLLQDLFIQCRCTDGIFTARICAFVVKEFISATARRIGRHPVSALADHHSGKQIFIFLRSGARLMISTFFRQHDLNLIEGFPIDDRFMFAFVDFAVVFKFPDIHPVSKHLVYFRPVRKEIAVFLPDRRKSHISGKVHPEEILHDLCCVRIDLQRIFYASFSAISIRYISPRNLSRRRDTVHFRGHALGGHLPFIFCRRDENVHHETTAGGEHIQLLTNGHKAFIRIADHLKKRKRVGKAARQTVQMPDDQTIPRTATGLQIRDHLLNAGPVQVFSGFQFVINFDESRGRIALQNIIAALLQLNRDGCFFCVPGRSLRRYPRIKKVNFRRLELDRIDFLFFTFCHCYIPESFS